MGSKGMYYIGIWYAQPYNPKGFHRKNSLGFKSSKIPMKIFRSKKPISIYFMTSDDPMGQFCGIRWPSLAPLVVTPNVGLGLVLSK